MSKVGFSEPVQQSAGVGDRPNCTPVEPPLEDVSAASRDAQRWKGLRIILSAPKLIPECMRSSLERSRKLGRLFGSERRLERFVIDQWQWVVAWFLTTYVAFWVVYSSELTNDMSKASHHPAAHRAHSNSNPNIAGAAAGDM